MRFHRMNDSNHLLLSRGMVYDSWLVRLQICKQNCCDINVGEFFILCFPFSMWSDQVIVFYSLDHRQERRSSTASRTRMTRDVSPRRLQAEPSIDIWLLSFKRLTTPLAHSECLTPIGRSFFFFFFFAMSTNNRLCDLWYILW